VVVALVVVVSAGEHQLEFLLLDIDQRGKTLSKANTIADKPLPIRKLRGDADTLDLNLSNFHFGPLSGIVIGRLLRENTVLRTLNLSSNHFGHQKVRTYTDTHTHTMVAEPFLCSPSGLSSNCPLSVP
jgi:hypothetical protein